MILYLLLGLTLAAGLWLLGEAIYRHSHINFADRIAPQLRSQELERRVSLSQADKDAGLLAACYDLLKPLINSWTTRFARQASTAGLAKRLVQAGDKLSVTDFRAQQLVWAMAAMASSGFVLGFAVLGQQLDPLPALLLVLLSSVCGYLARDWWLGRTIAQREKAMLAEFPALAELLALSVTAGESAVAAIERVCSSSRGELSAEFHKILSQTRAGDGLVTALQDFASRTQVQALSRFVAGIVVAVERGTPLAEVLRAQAQDVRDNAKRELMETAGKKEIAMLAPIVFLILPLTVVFAIFPGLSLINVNF